MKYMGMNTQLLQRLCSDGVWKYAVLWSLQAERPHLILTWGDVYVDKVIKDTQTGHLYDGPINSKNQIVSSAWCNNGQYQSHPLCPIEAALLGMSSHSYSLGEEIIGKVALTEQPRWIFANELCSTLMYKYHEDWQLQFVAGIKTVLLVPVVPHGVLQMGSMDMVSESLTLVALIKDLFYKYYDASIPYSSSATGFGYLNTTATLSMDSPYVVPHDLFGLISSSAQLLNINHLSVPHPLTMMEFPILEDLDTSLSAFPSEILDADESDVWTNFYEEPSQLTPCNTAFEPDMEKSSSVDKLTDPDNKLRFGSASHIEDRGYDKIDDFTPTDMGHMAHENRQHTHGNTIGANGDAVTSNSSFRSELHKDLDAITWEEHEDYMWYIRLKQLQEPTSPAHNHENGNKAEFYKQHGDSDYAEFLLNAIIVQVGQALNSESSHSTDSPVSCTTQIQKDDHAPRLDELSVPDLPDDPEFSRISVKEGFMTDSSCPRETNRTMVEEFIGNPIADVQMENSVEMNKRSKKVQLHRSRPRDRQLIQDRMEELRELVPNASKCSIDALLDRTITHMHFLQSVSDKAEKVENIMSREESSERQSERCYPLRVEELDQPGHLLIEMACEEHGLFLEIAHVLKGLDVSILRGVLECRSEKLWARFVIQVSQGCNQMQILCSLMHLLQRQRQRQRQMG